MILHINLLQTFVAPSIYPTKLLSCPGIATALILGHTLRVLLLCSKQSDIHNKLKQFYHQLIARGYAPTTILPLLTKAETNTRKRVANEKEINWDDQKKDKSDTDV